MRNYSFFSGSAGASGVAAGAGSAGAAAPSAGAAAPPASGAAPVAGTGWVGFAIDSMALAGSAAVGEGSAGFVASAQPIANRAATAKALNFFIAFFSSQDRGGIRQILAVHESRSASPPKIPAEYSGACDSRIFCVGRLTSGSETIESPLHQTCEPRRETCLPGVAFVL